MINNEAQLAVRAMSRQTPNLTFIEALADTKSRLSAGDTTCMLDRSRANSVNGFYAVL